MAKFCGNCGTQLEDDARVCGRCGTPVDGVQIVTPRLQIENPEKKRKQIKKVKIVIVLMAVAAVAITGIKICLKFTGTNGLVRKVMAAYEKYDIDALVAISSGMYTINDDENYCEEYFAYSVGNDIDDFESSVGHKYKLSYEIEEIYDLSQRKQDELLKKIIYSYPEFDSDSISKFAVADIKVTAKQGNKSIDKNIKITMSKEGKTWKLLYLE